MSWQKQTPRSIYTPSLGNSHTVSTILIWPLMGSRWICCMRRIDGWPSITWAGHMRSIWATPARRRPISHLEGGVGRVRSKAVRRAIRVNNINSELKMLHRHRDLETWYVSAPRSIPTHDFIEGDFEDQTKTRIPVSRRAKSRNGFAWLSAEESYVGREEGVVVGSWVGIVEEGNERGEEGEEWMNILRLVPCKNWIRGYYILTGPEMFKSHYLDCYSQIEHIQNFKAASPHFWRHFNTSQFARR